MKSLYNEPLWIERDGAMSNLRNDSLQLHLQHKGKREVRPKVAVENGRDFKSCLFSRSS